MKYKFMVFLFTFSLVGCDNSTIATPPVASEKEFIGISEIQGHLDSSPLLEEEVKIQGVVTGFTNEGFFLQEELKDQDNFDETSEGIFVQTKEYGDLNLSLNQIVGIKGTVQEVNGLTQIIALEILPTEQTDASIEPISIPSDYATFQFESVEGMLVKIEDQTIVDVYQLARYGEANIAPEILVIPTENNTPLSEGHDLQEANNAKYTLKIEDNTNQSNPSGISYFNDFGYDKTLKVGDRLLSAIGPLNFSYGSYRINLAAPEQVSFDIQNRVEIDDTPLNDPDIKIASFNVLNYFNGKPSFDQTIAEEDYILKETFDNFDPSLWRNKSGVTLEPSEDPKEISNKVLKVNLLTDAQSTTDVTTSIDVEAGQRYRFAIDALHTNGGMRITGVAYGNYTNKYTNPEQLNEWQAYAIEFEAKETGSIDIFLRFYDVAPAFKGEEIVYLDNISVYKIPSDSDSEAGVYLEQTFEENGRGVLSEEAFLIQQGRIVNALASLDADVVGLLEVENDGFGQYSAIESLVSALNKQLGPKGTYAVAQPLDKSLKIGTDEITVGLIYKTDKLTLEGPIEIIPMPRQTWTENGTEKFAAMRDSVVGRFTYNGGSDSFLVSVNHFKSKGSGCFEDVGTASPQDKVQGSCNALRVSAAVALAGALSSTSYPDKKIILGDLNSYSQEDPISVLTDMPDDLTYQIQPAVNTQPEIQIPQFGFGYVLVQQPEQYSYTYQSERGSLDHVLVSQELADSITGVKVWNINSIEPSDLLPTVNLFNYFKSEFHRENYYDKDGAYISSDHDPVVVGLNLSE